MLKKSFLCVFPCLCCSYPLHHHFVSFAVQE